MDVSFLLFCTSLNCKDPVYHSSCRLLFSRLSADKSGSLECGALFNILGWE